MGQPQRFGRVALLAKANHLGLLVSSIKSRRNERMTDSADPPQAFGLHGASPRYDAAQHTYLSLERFLEPQREVPNHGFVSFVTAFCRS
jgi:hypothetical protein